MVCVLGDLSQSSKTALATAECYTGGGEWSRLPDLPAPRQHHASAVIDNMLCVVGGKNNAKTLMSVVRELPGLVVWTAAPTTPTTSPNPRPRDCVAGMKEWRDYLEECCGTALPYTAVKATPFLPYSHCLCH